MDFVLTPLICMALNVYFESRNQPLIGQIATADTVLNRVHSEDFPDTVCEVVMQGETYSWNTELPIKNRCQFSWYCDGKSDTPKEPHAWDTALTVANGVYYGNLDDFVEGATHYHAHYVTPEWASTKTYITRIEDHIFYRWDIKYE